MTKNLFVCPLGDVVVADVRAFLNLDGEEDARLAEGERIEFKSDWDADLGETVAAFANTAGGLILLGVKENGANNRPTQIAGIQRTGELKARITAHIETTVRPRPRCQVHTLPIGPTDLAIVRVELGDEPPYMFSLNTKHRIAVRAGNQTKPADYSQLDALIRRRASKATEGGPFQSLDFVGSEIVPQVNGRHVPRQQLFARMGVASLRLHSEQEFLFRRAIAKSFVYERPLVATRHLDSIEFAPEASAQFPRIWRLADDGLVAFGSSIHVPGGAAANLFEMVADAVAFVRLVAEVIDALDLVGRLWLRHHITAPQIALDNPEGANHVNGVYDLNAVGYGYRTMWEGSIDPSELSQPAEILAMGFADLLRGEWGARVKAAKLAEAIAYHAKEIYDYHGDRPARSYPFGTKGAR
jgi:hypothetical protein